MEAVAVRNAVDVVVDVVAAGVDAVVVAEEEEEGVVADAAVEEGRKSSDPAARGAPNPLLLSSCLCNLRSTYTQPSLHT